jgi:hypothetical protein
MFIHTLLLSLLGVTSLSEAATINHRAELAVNIRAATVATLAANALQTGSRSNGQETPVSGQSASAT